MKNQEKNIIQGLQQQNKKSIALLYDQYGSTLYGIILRIVQSEEIAQDVLQEVFIKIWKNGARYDTTKGSIFTWMLNIARNTAIDKTRSAGFRQKAKIQDLDHTVHHNTHLITEQNTDVIGLKNFVNSLEEKYRQIIDLVYFRGYTQKEVQEHLNIPLGTVKSRIRIALRELKRIFDEQKINIIVLILSQLG